MNAAHIYNIFRTKEAAMLKKSTLAVTILILILTFTCGQQEGTYTVEVKDGVRYVHNLSPAWGDTLKIALEFVQKIGDLETEDENYQLYKLRDIERDAEGNLYVLDGGNYRIQKYDKNGNYLATIGRQGQGPGEFNYPMFIEFDPEGKLYIVEAILDHILVLTPDGKEEKRIKLDYKSYIFHFTSEGKIVGQGWGKWQKTENIARDNRLIYLYGKEGNFIKEFGEIKDYHDNERTHTGNSIDLCLGIDDNIYVTFRYQNRIEKYSSEGDIIFRADRTLNYKVGFIEEKSKISPIFYDVSNYIGIDHQNRVWVQTYKKHPEEGDEPADYLGFEIFNSDGILLGKLPIPQNVRGMRIFQDRLYLLDTFEEMCVYEYKIVEK